MRHRRRRGKLSLPSAHRAALLRNLVTLGKRGDLHARRQAASVIRTRAAVSKLFGDLAERYKARPGGYTRVLKSRIRVGDAAPLSIVELVDRAAAGKPAPEPTPEKKVPEKKTRAKKAPAKPAPEKKGAELKAPRKKKAAG